MDLSVELIIMRCEASHSIARRITIKSARRYIFLCRPPSKLQIGRKRGRGGRGRQTTASVEWREREREGATLSAPLLIFSFVQKERKSERAKERGAAYLLLSTPLMMSRSLSQSAQRTIECPLPLSVSRMSLLRFLSQSI